MLMCVCVCVCLKGGRFTVGEAVRAARFSAGCSEAVRPSGLWGRREEGLKLRQRVPLRRSCQQVINTHRSEARK